MSGWVPYDSLGPSDDWRSGFSSGESSVQVDWEFAIEDLLPEGVECYPSQVAAYIRRLQSGEESGTTSPQENR